MAFVCSYGTSWLGINSLVILMSLSVVIVVYMLSRFLPANTRAKLTGITKIELTQILISVFILTILVSITSALCLTTVSIGEAASSPNSIVSSYTSAVPFPALETPNVVVAAQTGDPFTYAESYTGNYAFNIGPNLAIQIYSYSYSFAIVSLIWYQVGDVLSDILPALNPVNTGPVSISLPLGIDLGIPYGTLSDVFIDILAPLTVLGIGIMLAQYILLVLSESIAFLVILPVALVLRSVAFSGGALRSAANSILAIAIAIYIIYPVMVVFDSYIVHWMFTECNGVATVSCNPSAVYLQATYSHEILCSLTSYGTAYQNCVIPEQSYPTSLTLQSGATFNFNMFAYAIDSITSIGNFFSGLFGYNGETTVLAVQYVILELSEFLFIVIVLFAINLTVTVGFSIGLTKALNNGIEGAASFWTNI